jgi:hypothetical protein
MVIAPACAAVALLELSLLQFCLYFSISDTQKNESFQKHFYCQSQSYNNLIIKYISLQGYDGEEERSPRGVSKRWRQQNSPKYWYLYTQPLFYDRLLYALLA